MPYCAALPRPQNQDTESSRCGPGSCRRATSASAERTGQVIHESIAPTMPKVMMRKMTPTIAPVQPKPRNGTDAPDESAALERAMTNAGFTEVNTERRTVTLEFPSCEAYTSFILDVSGSVTALLANQPVQKQSEVRGEIEKAVERFATGDGHVSLPNETICVVGRQVKSPVHGEQP